MQLPKVVKSERITGEKFKGAVLYHQDGSECAFVSIQLTKQEFEQFTKEQNKNATN